ncbi:MAG: cytochrome P460 family protein [Akkermansiaceae bacterium]
MTDDQRAAALWQKIQGFNTWSSPPGLEGLVEGDSVHGDYVRFYANGIALAGMRSLPNGSIVVKEGFHDDQGDLKAITVMEKVDGFSEDSGDWFFSRFDRVGNASKVNSNSCIRCHRKADDGDFSFAND